MDENLRFEIGECILRMSLAGTGEVALLAGVCELRWFSDLKSFTGIATIERA